MEDYKPKILIYGAGSIGTYLGTKLFSAGDDVKMIGGRKLKNAGKFVLVNSDTCEVPPTIDELDEEQEYDIIFVTTKLYDVKEAINDINRHKLRPKTIVFIQNGLVDENFYSAIKDDTELATISVFDGYRLTDNELAANKSNLGWQIDASVAGEKISELLKSAGVDCNTNPEIERIRAEKMVISCAVNALSALENKTVGELSLDEGSRDKMNAIIEEAYAVLKDEYELTEMEEFKRLFYEIIEQYKTHYSSMYQDIQSGRETEIDFLNGFITRKGKENGIETPINEDIYRKIKELTENLEPRQEQKIKLK